MACQHAWLTHAFVVGTEANSVMALQPSSQDDAASCLPAGTSIQAQHVFKLLATMVHTIAVFHWGFCGPGTVSAAATEHQQRGDAGQGSPGSPVRGSEKSLSPRPTPWLHMCPAGTLSLTAQ